MKLSEAREVVGQLMARAETTPLSLSALEEKHADRRRYCENWQSSIEGKVLSRSRPVERWAWLFDEATDGLNVSWSDEKLHAISLLMQFVQGSIDDAIDVAEGGHPSSFATTTRGDDPFGELYARFKEGKEARDSVDYSITDKPNHTLVDLVDGVPVFEKNESPPGAEEKIERGIQEYLEVEAARSGFSFAEYVASPGRGRASRQAGARLDALASSIRDLIAAGYKVPAIGKVIGRDKRRMSELVKRA